jgi:hypothetical protein
MLLSRIAALSGLLLTVGCAGDPPAAPPTVAMAKARFPHDQHVLKQKLECVTCHHETNARAIVTPHPAYLDGAGIDCTVCHHGTDRPREPQACAECHPVTPPSIADETLSAKVVIHKTCWRCHPIGEAPRAGGVCLTCHGSEAPPVLDKFPPRYFQQRTTTKRTK